MKSPRLQVGESIPLCLMISQAFLLLLLQARFGAQARSLKHDIHGEQVAQDYTAQAHRLQGLASPSFMRTSTTLSSTSAALSPTTAVSLSAASSCPLSMATTSGMATPMASPAAMEMANSMVQFSIYSTPNLPTGVLAPPSSCADAMMATIECNSTILLMGYDSS